MKRSEAREAVFALLFETEFRTGETPEAIFESSVSNREIVPDDYMRAAYFGVLQHLDTLDALISRHARGWNVTRLSRVSRALLRLAAYEMSYCPDIPANVSMNEAIELSKKYDDEKARPFVNGVLNGIKNELASAQND